MDRHLLIGTEAGISKIVANITGVLSNRKQLNRTAYIIPYSTLSFVPPSTENRLLAKNVAITCIGTNRDMTCGGFLRLAKLNLYFVISA